MPRCRGSSSSANYVSLRDDHCWWRFALAPALVTPSSRINGTARAQVHLCWSEAAQQKHVVHCSEGTVFDEGDVQQQPNTMISWSVDTPIGRIARQICGNPSLDQNPRAVRKGCSLEKTSSQSDNGRCFHRSCTGARLRQRFTTRRRRKGCLTHLCSKHVVVCRILGSGTREFSLDCGADGQIGTVPSGGTCMAASGQNSASLREGFSPSLSPRAAPSAVSPPPKLPVAVPPVLARMWNSLASLSAFVSSCVSRSTSRWCRR